MTKTIKESRKTTNVPKVENIDINLIDENPDNEKVFNMERIEQLEQSIKDNGFLGAINVFKKPDGRYEISAGHRRFRAVKELGRDTIPCFVSEMPDDPVKMRRLLDTNITNREMSPVEKGRIINYYTSYLKLSGFKGDIDSECAKYFGISHSSVYKYKALTKMIPQLQELADDERFPYSAFTSAYRLSEEKQKELCDELKFYASVDKDEDGTPAPVSRKLIVDSIRDKLKEEDSYKESRNKKIATRRKEIEDEKKDRKKPYRTSENDGKREPEREKETVTYERPERKPLSASATDPGLIDRLGETESFINGIAGDTRIADKDREKVRMMLTSIKDDIEFVLSKI